MNRVPKFFVGVASKDHVATGVELGIGQFCHGKLSTRLARGDFVVYYSSKMAMGEAAPCQQFTAIGRVADDAYQVDMGGDFKPYRHNITYFLPAKHVDIRPLIPSLAFIKNKKYWGLCLRSGLLEIDRPSFELIATHMLGKAPPVD